MDERLSEQNELVVKVYKYDGTEHRSWRACLATYEGELIVLDATFADEVQHDLLGQICSGTISTEYYWLNRWYNIFRFSEPNGRLLSFYCNVSFPPTFTGQVLSYIDLDVDILVQPDFSYRILDTEDFEANIRIYGYTHEVQQGVKRATDQLVSLIEARTFPFNV